MASPQPARSRDRSGKAILSLILGIASFFIVPIVTGVLAIIFGAVARRDMAARPRLEGRGLATAGIILGVIGLILGVIALFMVPGTGWWRG